MRQIWKSAVPVSIILVFTAAGCMEDDITGAASSAARHPSASEQSGPRTHDDELARIAREEIPGFAGYYIDGDGNDVVLLTDTTQRGRAVVFARQRRQDSRLPAARATTIRHARWDFATLKEWHDRLIPRLLGAGVVFTDVAE